MKLIRLGWIVSSLFVVGCATQSQVEKPLTDYSSQVSDPFTARNYRAADKLISQLDNRISKTQPIIIATIVNIDELSTSSTFGRITSEQISGRFTQSGYSMIEMKFRGDVYMKQDQGELLLTREIKNLATSQNAQAVIVGSYAKSNQAVFVNLKVINPNTNVVIAVTDYTFELDSSLRSMLGRGSASYGGY